VTLLETLGGEIGVRTAGSPEAARAADAIAEAFRALGLEPRFQPFQFLGYDAEEPELEIDGQPWPAGPSVYSDATPNGGVEGRIRYAGIRVDIPKTFEAPIFTIEDESGPELGRLWVNPIGGAIPFPAGYSQILTAPTAVISKADGERLREMEGAHARLVTRGRFVPGRRDCNVIAELPGESEERVIVGAHFDSVWRGPGVIDNATGVEGVRRVAERLVGRRHDRTLVFVAFGAEELGLLGSRFYVEEAKVRAELDRVAGVVNLDCIAHGDHLELLCSPEELRGRAGELARTLGLADRYKVDARGPDPGTDHYYFTQEGVPGVSVLFFPYPEYHLPAETFELVNAQMLDDAVELAVALTESQLERPAARAKG
jgi:aminopeptidase YwaD